MTKTTAAFDRAFQAVIGHEGGFTDNKKDRGNWTSGKVGVGELKGTKYGISAMAYPTLDIGRITLADAKHIYHRDYWLRCACDLLPAAVGLQVFDAAVNHGNARAIKLLQQALGVAADGSAGPITRAAAQAADAPVLLLDFLAARLRFYTELSTWPDFGKGWARRVAAQMQLAAQDIKRG